jgi:FMN phosphatase YigB (HAD superfamily)
MKFVYFDIGGVMIKDFSGTDKWQKMMADWTTDPDTIRKIDDRFEETENEFCKGRDIDDFTEMLKREFGIELPANYDIKQDFVSRFEKNEGMWEIVRNCQKKYKIGLLTAMYPGLLNEIKRQGLMPDIEWGIIVDSSIVGSNKPEKEIYIVAEKMTGVDPNEILFIDNKEKNLVVPREFGWQTFFFNSNDYEQSNKELKAFLG